MRAGGHATAEDTEAVAKHLASSMSLAQLQKVQSLGIHFTAARDSVTDYLTNLKGVHPRGYPPGATWDNVTGTVNPASSRDVIIATHAGPNGGRKVPGAAQSSSADVMTHELGHAINRREGSLFRWASDRDDFKSAYNADAEKGPLADPYYHQADAAAGRDEAYAESHATYIHDPEKMRTQYPHLYAYWQHYYGANR